MSNIGNMKNLTGHVLAAANTYACGRLAWDPTLAADVVDREWVAMTFPPTEAPRGRGGGSVLEGGMAEWEGEGENNAVPASVVATTVADTLNRSWLVYEGYTSPMGIGFIIGQNNPFGVRCATLLTTQSENTRRTAVVVVVAGGGGSVWMTCCSSIALLFSQHPIAPKTNRSKGEGPGGIKCPPTPPPPPGVSYCWPNSCDDYDFSNYSHYGVG